MATAFIAVASVMSIAAASLMVRKSLRARTSDGLALGLLILSGVSLPSWMAYGMARENWFQVGSTLPWLVAVALWWGFWATDQGRSFWVPFLGVWGWSALLVGVALIPGFPFAIFGWIGGLAGLLGNVPQVREVFLEVVPGAAFSVRGWVANAVSLTAWVGYAVLAGDVPVLVTNSIALALVLTILARVAWMRKRSSADT